MNRREFFQLCLKSGCSFTLLGIASCGRDPADQALQTIGGTGRVILYDTFAMALYMDGGLGPKTGIIKVDYILKNESITLEFWHGHGGKNHQFTLTPAHFSELKKLKRIYVETTPVAGHTHKLFVDPVDPKYRVPGAQPVDVPDNYL